MNVSGYWNPLGVNPSFPNAGPREGTGGGDEALRRVCLEFEAVFVREVLSASGLENIFGPLDGLEGEVEGEGWPGIPGAGIYAGEALDSLAGFLASRGMLGLGDLLYRSLAGPSPAGGGEESG
ncbi:MAG: hypothetical protein H5T72_08560 [Actinobacteria bacterium]|nr:hypothetical protein [Actinomycetota bacterium]